MVKELALTVILLQDFECEVHVPYGCTQDDPCFYSDPMWQYMPLNFKGTERKLTIRLLASKPSSWRVWCGKLLNLKVTKDTEPIPFIEKREALCEIGCGHYDE